MHLKNLTVFGFKSFADKTSLNFQPGITAIVGPNGCGKSNVADAVRWVLGEQSAKALRGGEMADVIFNGTDGRKPLSMAEVSLTIGDVDVENLRASGVEIPYNEVTLTRRVFRDGGSEYFINKIPCRLKDIQQLFMGTGVGRTSYSIMAQGNITQILSSKPEDRRMVFEEAAGITKFKSQKRETLRKLEYTDQNLLRIADLIREVKRQIGSLQRQAGKARRYKQLQAELQHLDSQLARHQFDVLQSEIHQLQESAEKLRREMESSTESVLRAENEISQLRERLSELEHEIAGAQQQCLELKNQVDRFESRIQFNEQRLAELADQKTKAETEIAEAETRRLQADEELASLSERLRAATLDRDQQRQLLVERQTAVAAIENDLRQRHEALRQAQSDAFSAAQQLTRVRNEVNALDLQKQGNVARMEKLSAEKIQLEEERTRLEERLVAFAADVESERLNVQTHRGTVEQRQQRLREIQQELTSASQTQDALLQQQTEKRSRLNVLEQLDETHEGFSAGALAALKQSVHVFGSLADKIRVPDRYVVAVETALGHHLQLVLTESPDSARNILADLAANKKGRASVAALGLTPDQPGSEANGTPVEGRDFDPFVMADSPAAETRSMPVLALSVIDADASVQTLLGRLLGRTWIVPDLVVATQGWRQTSGRCDFVTLAGDLLSRQGVFTGGYLNGSGSGKAPASILGRKNQIAELQRHLGDLHRQVSDASRRKGALVSEQTALQASLQEAQSVLREREVAIATHQGEVNALQNSRRVLHQKIDTVVYEIQSLAAQEEEGRQKRAVLAAQIEQFETRDRELETRLNEETVAIEALRQHRESAQTALTETKVAVATVEQLVSSMRVQQQPIERRLVELQQLLEQRQREIESFDQRRSQAETEIAEAHGRIESLRHQCEQVDTQLAVLVGQRETRHADLSGREESLREIRRTLSSLQEQRSAMEIELAQKHMAVANLRERIQQKYQVNLDDVRSECITITIADGGPPKVQTLTPEEMAASGVSTDWTAVQEQVGALQKRIEEIGPVNLVAIEEYEETEQRHQFLTTQFDDLVKAKAELLEVINRINSQTREMFTLTFNQIRENFRALFAEVFGGGKADLHLVDEGDVLESGIDIVARPPGKQLQSISLLSGGEQTMTAVALLFAIYQVKPSPFCVLDELDAPLDESNINRFIRVLQRFLADSQFVIITHNKRTIGMADVLYGVTMQEHGVSRIVSVKFHKVEDPMTDHRLEPLVPPATVPSVENEEDEPHRAEETLEIVMAK